MNEEGKLIRIFPALSERDLTVEAMDFEVCVRNALKRNGIHTLNQLLQLSHAELLRIFPNRRLRSYEDVIHCLVCLSDEPEGMEAAAPVFASVTDINNTLGGKKMSDKKFNIFQVAGIWKSEEIHTSVIAELINPKSAFHNMGAVFLDRFLQMRKIDIKLTPEELAEAKVETEVPTEMGRRIDMVISTKSRYLPFEVKIWAGDQKAQLRDYYDFAKKQAQAEDQKIYYLTPTGREPGKQSLGDLPDTCVRQLSFQEDICRWLDDCMDKNQFPELPTDVFEIMKQLKDNIVGGRPGIQGFSRWAGEDVLDDIYQKLSLEHGNLAWTECTADYMTFTLNIMKFGTASLEFALRVKKEPGNRERVRLYLICGVTQGDEKPDYSDPGDYISKNAKEFETLLEATFKKGGEPLGLNISERAWNRLPEGEYKELNAEKCCIKIKKIFEELK